MRANTMIRERARHVGSSAGVAMGSLRVPAIAVHAPLRAQFALQTRVRNNARFSFKPLSLLSGSGTYQHQFQVHSPTAAGSSNLVVAFTYSLADDRDYRSSPCVPRIRGVAGVRLDDHHLSSVTCDRRT